MGAGGRLQVASVGSYVDVVLQQVASWQEGAGPDWPPFHAWFRGEPVVEHALLPKLYRREPPYRESDLLQRFRNMAVLPQFNSGINRESNDLWLYLAQHFGLPTRLLDWTEGALIALFFAVSQDRPARVWMLYPYALNFIARAAGGDFEVPWEPTTLSAACIKAAWHNDDISDQPDLPIALYPMHVHSRLQVQRSCFTIHGRNKAGLEEQLSKSDLRGLAKVLPSN